MVTISSKSFQFSKLWTLLIFTSFLPIVYLAIAGNAGLASQTAFNSSVAFGVFVTIMFVFIMQFLSGWVQLPHFSIRPFFPTEKEEYLVALSFYAGVFLFLAIQLLSTLSFSQSLILSISPVFSSVANISDQFAQIALTTISVPVGEEIIFLIAIPFFVVTFLELLYAVTKSSIFINKLFALVAIIVVTAPIFAVFHAQALQFSSFLIFAIVFRTILLVIVWGDDLLNLIPWISVLPAFAIGFHMINNIFNDGGIGVWVSTLLFSPFPGWIFGVIVFSVYVVMAYVLVDGTYKWIVKHQRQYVI